MVKVLLHIPDLNEDPHPSEVYHLVQLRLMDVDPHKMERQVDAIDNKYLEIQYYDNPHWLTRLMNFWKNIRTTVLSGLLNPVTWICFP